MKTFRKGGVHPADCKLTADSPITRHTFDGIYRLPLSQHIGARSAATVKPGQHVARGEMVAEAGGYVSAPVHSPVDGTVIKIEDARTPQGMWQKVITIEADTEQTTTIPSPKRTLQQALETEPATIIEEIRQAGIVGLGGASFPTCVKLSLPDGKTADTLVINGAECEPWLTCDDRLMSEYPDKIIAGSLILARAICATNVNIGIEDNKPRAIAAMKKAASACRGVHVTPLKKKYPQGSEKQLIKAITGRSVPTGGLPVDSGVVVDNVATAAAVYDAICLGLPLTERVVTVTGPSLSSPGNFLVPLGISIRQLIGLAGGLPDDTGKIIAGGPMMGRAVSNIDAPVTKATGGITVFPENMAHRSPDSPCIRCGRCVQACPMGLEPYLLIALAENERWEDMAAGNVAVCLECGCCSYTCPASRPLLDYIKLGKTRTRNQNKK